MRKSKIKKCMIHKVGEVWRIRREGDEHDWTTITDDMYIVEIDYPTLEDAVRDCHGQGCQYEIKLD